MIEALISLIYESASTHLATSMSDFGIVGGLKGAGTTSASAQLSPRFSKTFSEKLQKLRAGLYQIIILLMDSGIPLDLMDSRRYRSSYQAVDARIR